MADFTLSPNMSMPVPTVAEAPGPGWATNIDASLSIIDGHNHSSGQGVQINPAGININTDLLFNNNNATTVRSVNFQSQPSPLSLITDVGCLYVSGIDLYYNDEGGTQIRITQGGAVSGSAGTITGLPSGTASASFSAGTFTFQSATNTPASMNVGPVSIGNNVLNSKTVTIFPNAGIASNYNLSLPAALPGALNYVTLDNSGNLSFNSSGTTGSGAVVLANNPSFLSGISFTSGTLDDYQESTWVPVIGTAAIIVAGTPVFQLIGNYVIGHMRLDVISIFSGLTTVTLPITPAINFANNAQLIGVASASTTGVSAILQSNTGTTTALLQVAGASSGYSFNVIFRYNIND